MDHFVDLSQLSTQAAAARIAADQLHVLITLDGWTEGSRNDILAWHPAPIQLAVRNSRRLLPTRCHRGG